MLGFVQFNNVSIFACKIIVTTLGQDNTYQTPTKNQRRLTSTQKKKGLGKMQMGGPAISIKKIFLKYRPIPASFSFIFILFSFQQIQFQFQQFKLKNA